jgi:hypothetical protein
VQVTFILSPPLVAVPALAARLALIAVMSILAKVPVSHAQSVLMLLPLSLQTVLRARLVLIVQS